jgi:hypothetical protein
MPRVARSSARTDRSSSPLVPAPWSQERVTAGSSATSAGWSHSWETPTSSWLAPRAQTISVADGSSDTTRKLHLRIIGRLPQGSLSAPVGQAKAVGGDPTVAG